MKYLQLAAMTFLLSQSVLGETLNPKYFANLEVQRLAPIAFALQPEAHDFHKYSEKESADDIQNFLKSINDNTELKESILKFKELSLAQKEKVLRVVFDLEVLSLKITPPKLVIDSTSIPGQAFFEFDVENPTAGTVYLNTDALSKDENPYAALLLLIHETRHSAQFQMAFLGKNPKSPLAKFYKEAFIAQKKYNNKITSFCDFLTLINEYEAFKFGNFIVESLTNGQVDTLGMGTYASQFNSDLSLKIDLPKLFNEHKGSVLEEFNKLEKAQYDILVK